MRILYIGDVMAEMGIAAVETVLPELIRQEKIDFVVAQAENVSDGKGMRIADYERLKKAGVHACTGGNHTFVRSEIKQLLEDDSIPVVGPANMSLMPGPGYKLVETACGAVLIISVLGSIVGKDSASPVQNPLKTVDEILAHVPPTAYRASVVNIHGDFSSEKLVMGYYLDGRASLVVGDHWHIPTADAEILPGGTAHITDVGMCGSLDSSLGVKIESIVLRWRDGYQTRNELEQSGRSQFCAVLAETDSLGHAISIRPVRQVW